MERTPNESQHRKLNCGEENYPSVSAGFMLAIFRFQVRHFTNRAVSPPASLPLLEICQLAKTSNTGVRCTSDRSDGERCYC